MTPPEVSAVPPKLVLVGYPERFHLGAILKHAAETLNIPAHFMDVRQAHDGNWLLQRLYWRFRDHRPVQMGAFNKSLIDACRRTKPSIVLVTGMIPPNRSTLQTLKDLGITCINFLTDDPWNPHHSAKWFFDTLPLYDIVYSPRRANIPDLTRLGCRVEYLPFGYDPSLHFPDRPLQESMNQYVSDVLFYGGADEDRLPYINALIEAGHNLHLYGGYWQRHLKTKPFYKGMADAQTLRWAVSGTKVTLCLVRRANRDGHVMRTFEAPAMGACLLVEDTDEHRQIFGPEWENVVYFSTEQEMCEKASLLVRDPGLRTHLAENAHNLIVQGKNTYGDRLKEMLNSIGRKKETQLLGN